MVSGPNEVALPRESEPPRLGATPLEAVSSARERFEAWQMSRPDYRDPLSPDQRSTLRSWETPLPEAFRKSGTGSVIQGWSLWPTFDPQKTVVIGGICSLFTADRSRIRSGELAFTNVAEFERWFRSWYPRLDQVHDAVGIPPKGVPRVCYVVEDSIWARRIEADSKGVLPAAEVAKVLRSVHEEQGAPLVSRWLKLGGYRGSVEAVYTSDVEVGMATALRVWETSLGASFKPGQWDLAKVYLMYTGLWPNVLGITDPVIIYEPRHHFDEAASLKVRDNESGITSTGDWFNQNPYAARSGFNRSVGAIGFAPACCASGVTRELPLEEVPNIGNWNRFALNPADAFFYGVTLFPKWSLDRTTREVPTEEMSTRVTRSIYELYGEV